MRESDGVCVHMSVCNERGTAGTGGVIKGWEQGFLLLKVGELAKLVCPPKLAYGKKGMGDKVPPDSTLEFEVEVSFRACVST